MPAEIVQTLVTEEDLMNVQSNESTCETGAYEEESDESNETNAVYKSSSFLRSQF